MNNKDSVLRTPSDYHSKDHSFNLTVSFKILLVPLLTVMMSCSVVGAFETDDPYGPVVNCDANQPMDNLLKCVEKEYAWMDKVYMSEKIRKRKKIMQWGAKPEETPIHYTIASNFPKIKKDVYDRTRDGDIIFQLRVDEYDNKKFGIMQNSGEIMIRYIPPQPQRAYTWNMHVKKITPQKYVRSYHSPSRDILITKENNHHKLHVSSYEVVPLRKKQALYIISIHNYCELDTPKKVKNSPTQEPWLTSEKYEYCGTYHTYFTKEINKNIEYRTSVPVTEKLSNQPWDSFPIRYWGTYVDYEKYPDKIIYLGADRRENPSKLYIQLDGKNLEIDLKQ